MNESGSNTTSLLTARPPASSAALTPTAALVCACVVAGGYSTQEIPVWHVPKDDLGGGSAWAAGMMHALHFQPVAADAHLAALRRADLLSALCQETAGDFSAVTLPELEAAEARFSGVAARLPGAPPAHTSGATLTPPATTLADVALPPLPSPAAAAAAVQATARGLRRAGVLAILRVKPGRPDAVEAAIARGVELASMGCEAIEVTLDSADWDRIVHGLRLALPPHVQLGIGTVMDESVSQIGRAAALGATFALSPIDPIGMIDECHRRGVLAVPSALSSNEMYGLHRRGAQMIKLVRRAPRPRSHPSMAHIRIHTLTDSLTDVSLARLVRRGSSTLGSSPQRSSSQCLE